MLKCTCLCIRNIGMCNMVFSDTFKSCECEICWHGSGYDSQRLGDLDVDWSYPWISALHQWRAHSIWLLKGMLQDGTTKNDGTMVYIYGRLERPERRYILSYLESAVWASFTALQIMYTMLCGSWNGSMSIRAFLPCWGFYCPCLFASNLYLYVYIYECSLQKSVCRYGYARKKKRLFNTEGRSYFCYSVLSNMLLCKNNWEYILFNNKNISEEKLVYRFDKVASRHFSVFQRSIQISSLWVNLVYQLWRIKNVFSDVILKVHLSGLIMITNNSRIEIYEFSEKIDVIRIHIAQITFSLSLPLLISY